MATTALPRLSVSRGGFGPAAPGPAYVPATSQRDPIIGTIRPFQKQQLSRRPSYGLSSSCHERSVFENTGYGSSYFIIHPDWTSEASGRRKLTASRERQHQSWDGRPAVHPLSAYIDPLLEKRRLRDQYIKAMEQAKNIEQSRSNSSQFRMRNMKPMTPKDSQGRYKGFSMY